MIIEIKRKRDVAIVSAKLIYIFRQVLLGFKTQKLTVPGTVFSRHSWPSIKFRAEPVV